MSHHLLVLLYAPCKSRYNGDQFAGLNGFCHVDVEAGEYGPSASILALSDPSEWATRNDLLQLQEPQLGQRGNPASVTHGESPFEQPCQDITVGHRSCVGEGESPAEHRHVNSDA